MVFKAEKTLPAPSPGIPHASWTLLLSMALSQRTFWKLAMNHPAQYKACPGLQLLHMWLGYCAPNPVFGVVLTNLG